MLRVILALAFLTSFTHAAYLRSPSQVSAIGTVPISSGVAGSSVPSNKRFLMFFRGQSFRSKKDAPEGEKKEKTLCASCAKMSQLDDAASFLKNVVRPLESFGNKIKVILTEDESDAPRCKFFKELEAIFGGRSQETVELKPLTEGVNETYEDGSLKRHGQSWNFRAALDALNDHYGGAAKIKTNFDYVMVLRYDIHWHRSILDPGFDGDYGNLNFVSRMRKHSWGWGGENNLNDAIQLLPASLYKIFDQVIGTEDCFYSQTCCAHGHLCHDSFTSALAQVRASLGWMTSERIDTRDTNGYVELSRPTC